MLLSIPFRFIFVTSWPMWPAPLYRVRKVCNPHFSVRPLPCICPSSLYSPPCGLQSFPLSRHAAHGVPVIEGNQSTKPSRYSAFGRYSLWAVSSHSPSLEPHIPYLQEVLRYI